MFDLLAAISSFDPSSLLAWLVLAFAAGMYPVGIMLGSSCSPCCSCSCLGGCSPDSPAPCSLKTKLTWAGLQDGYHYRTSNLFNCNSGSGGFNDCLEATDVGPAGSCRSCFRIDCGFISAGNGTYELEKTSGSCFDGVFRHGRPCGACYYAYSNPGAQVEYIAVYYENALCNVAGKVQWTLHVRAKTKSGATRILIPGTEVPNCSTREYQTPEIFYTTFIKNLSACVDMFACTSSSIAEDLTKLSLTDIGHFYVVNVTPDCCNGSVEIEFVE
jgi:hypothetical protein